MCKLMCKYMEVHSASFSLPDNLHNSAGDEKVFTIFSSPLWNFIFLPSLTTLKAKLYVCMHMYMYMYTEFTCKRRFARK
jgi:hypothetical protein